MSEPVAANTIKGARLLRRVAPLLMAVPLLGNTPAAAPAELHLTFENMRDTKGTLQLCLTRDARHFPNCETDPAAVKRSVAATTSSVRLTLPQQGRYAVSVLHDANSNGRIDKTLGIPREGFGFSRNPPIRFGPPKFDSTLLEIGPGVTEATVRMKYLL